MKKEYLNIFEHYTNNIKDYADNTLKHDYITKDEYDLIIAACGSLFKTLEKLEPKEPEKIE